LILDTNALSAMADGDSGLESVLQQAREIAIPAIVLGEYRFGVKRSRKRKSYEQWLEELISTIRVLPVDITAAICYSEIRDELKTLGRQIPGNDLWIAAIVRDHRLPLLSRDTHFDSVPGIRRISW
jgi:tRNA(fMet)-specific endonuclease VapC